MPGLQKERWTKRATACIAPQRAVVQHRVHTATGKLLGDPGRLRQVRGSLWLSALTFTPDSGALFPWIPRVVLRKYPFHLNFIF